MNRVTHPATISVALLLLSACATPDPVKTFAPVAHDVSARSGAETHWDTGSGEDAAVRDAVDELLASDLDAAGAVQIALLSNPSLQATYEDLGVAQADLVQAGLLKNPVFSASVRFPSGDGGNNTEFGIVQNFLDLLMLPARTRIAETEFEKTRLRVTHAVLAFAARVRAAAYEFQAAQNRRSVLRQITDAADAAQLLAQRMAQAGNATDLFLANQQAVYEQARVALARSETDVRTAREKLNALMGLWGARTTWHMAEKLPDIPVHGVALDHLESLAVANRLDLAASRKQVEAAAAALNVTEDFRWLGALDFGASTERDPDGTRVTGPNVSLELPIFDQHQAGISKAESELRRARRNYAALAISIRSEVRAARDRMTAARDLAEHYRDVVVPLQERLVALTQRQFNFMQTGAFDLLLAKQNEIRTFSDYVDAVRDYWLARTDLELAVGGSLTAAAQLSRTGPAESGEDRRD